MDFKKYWIETALVLLAAIALLAMAIPVLAANWLLIVGITFALTSPKTIPLAWSAFKEISAFIDDKSAQQEQLLLMSTVRRRLALGDNTEYNNAVTGIAFKVSLPPRIVEEDEEEDEQLQIEAPIPQAPHFKEMSHLITTKQMPLCYTLDGPAFGTVNDLLSMAVAGKPGRGKTTALMYYVCMLLKNGAEVFIWDPHGAMNELAALNGRDLPEMPVTARVTYLDRREDIVESVPTLQRLLVERDEYYRDGHKTKHPLLILADELPVLADYDAQVVAEYKAMNKRLVKDGDEELVVPSLITLIRRFVLEARKWNCYFIGSSQTMDAQVLPTKVVESMSSRIVFFSSDRRARMSGLETDAIKNLLPQVRRAGSGVMIFDCSRWDKPEIAAIPMIEVDDMLEYLGIGATFVESFVSEGGNKMCSGNGFGNTVETAPILDLDDVDDLFPDGTEAPSNLRINSISDEKRETIKRLADMDMKHRDIARVVGLSGRKYHIYKQICIEEGIVPHDSSEGEA